MKVKKVLLIIGFVALALYIGSVIVMQRMINEVALLADEHCLVVNPLIIQRKLVYLDTNKRFLETENINVYIAGNKEYFELSDQYVVAERSWLAKLSAFMQRLDYKILSPQESKRVYEAQYKAYLLDLESAEALKAMYVSGEDVDDKDIEQSTIRANQKYDAFREYDEALEAVGGSSFIQKPFLRWPASTCPPENYDIPNVNEMLFPDSGKPGIPGPVT